MGWKESGGKLNLLQIIPQLVGPELLGSLLASTQAGSDPSVGAPTICSVASKPIAKMSLQKNIIPGTKLRTSGGIWWKREMKMHSTSSWPFVSWIGRCRRHSFTCWTGIAALVVPLESDIQLSLNSC